MAQLIAFPRASEGIEEVEQITPWRAVVGSGRTAEFVSLHECYATPGANTGAGQSIQAR